jgi:hypothetical protein
MLWTRSAWKRPAIFLRDTLKGDTMLLNQNLRRFWHRCVKQLKRPYRESETKKERPARAGERKITHHHLLHTASGFPNRDEHYHLQHFPLWSR